MNAEQVIQNVEAIGGLLFLEGERIRYELPVAAAPLLNDLRKHRDAVFGLLRTRVRPPRLPKGVRLVRWEPKAPPVVLTRWSVVIDTHQFISSTLREMRAALGDKNWLAGNWSLRELTERLEQVGVLVEVDQTVRREYPWR
jgi:hypothetical protein